MATSAPMDNKSFFTEYGEANRFSIHEVIGKGSYGVVCSATDNKTGEKVAIKKISNAFEDAIDCKRMLREMRLLQHFKHENVLCLKDMNSLSLATIKSRASEIAAVIVNPLQVIRRIMHSHSANYVQSFGELCTVIRRIMPSHSATYAQSFGDF